VLLHRLEGLPSGFFVVRFLVFLLAGVHYFASRSSRLGWSAVRHGSYATATAKEGTRGTEGIGIKLDKNNGKRRQEQAKTALRDGGKQGELKNMKGHERANENTRGESRPASPAAGTGAVTAFPPRTRGVWAWNLLSSERAARPQRRSCRRAVGYVRTNGLFYE
jgi:hypothetical protein